MIPSQREKNEMKTRSQSFRKVAKVETERNFFHFLSNKLCDSLKCTVSFFSPNACIITANLFPAINSSTSNCDKMKESKYKSLIRLFSLPYRWIYFEYQFNASIKVYFTSHWSPTLVLTHFTSVGIRRHTFRVWGNGSTLHECEERKFVTHFTSVKENVFTLFECD